MKHTNFYILIFLSLLLVTNTQAQSDKLQKYVVGINKPTYSANYETKLLYKKLVKKIKTDFDLNHFPLFLIIPEASIENTRLIEGMDTKTLVELRITLKVENTAIKDEWTWEKTFNGKGDNKNKSIYKAIGKFVKKKNGYKDFKSKLITYIQKEYKDNCSKYIEMANGKFQDKKYSQCIGICRYLPEESSCYSEASALKRSAFDAIQKHDCESLLYKAKMKKSIKDYDSAINYLIRISPESPCAEKAISLAQEMESAIDKNIKSIDLYKIIINSSSDASSKELWLKNAMDNLNN